MPPPPRPTKYHGSFYAILTQETAKLWSSNSPEYASLLVSDWKFPASWLRLWKLCESNHFLSYLPAKRPNKNLVTARFVRSQDCALQPATFFLEKKYGVFFRISSKTWQTWWAPIHLYYVRDNHIASIYRCNMFDFSKSRIRTLLYNEFMAKLLFCSWRKDRLVCARTSRLCDTLCVTLLRS